MTKSVPKQQTAAWKQPSVLFFINLCIFCLNATNSVLPLRKQWQQNVRSFYNHAGLGSLIQAALFITFN